MKKKLLMLILTLVTIITTTGCSSLEEPKPGIANEILGDKNFEFTKKYSFKKEMVKKTPYDRYKTYGGTTGLTGMAVAGVASLAINKSREGEFFYKVLWKITNDKNKIFYLETQCKIEEECLQQMKDYVEDQL